MAAKPGLQPRPEDAERVDADPLRCLDPEASARMVAEVDAAKADADTLGGIVEVLAYGVPPGLGSHVQWDRKLDARLATALMSIQAIKGVEIGDAWQQARSRGSVAHDEIVPTATGVRRVTDRAGGLEGGMTTGEPVRVRAAMKPISSLNRALSTVDVSTGEPATAINQRSDVCAVPAAAVVAEAMVALVLAEAAHREVRRGLGGRDPAQPHRLPRPSGDPVTGPVCVLVGAPGAGKTTTGRALAAALGVRFLDTDADMELIGRQADPGDLRRRGRGAVPGAGAGGGGVGAGLLRRGAGPRRRGDPGRGDPGGARRAPRGAPVGRAGRRDQAGRAGRRSPAAGDQPAGHPQVPDGSAPPALRRGGHADGGHRRAHPRRGRRRDPRRTQEFRPR